MTVRIWHEIQNDAQYMAIFQDNPFDKSTTFVAGKDPVIVPRGEKIPDVVRHAITTVQLVELLDAILAQGIRPSSNAWSAGHVSDLKAHIAFAESMAKSLLDQLSPAPERVICSEVER